MKYSLRMFGLIGFILFGTGFGLTFSVPGFVEDIGKTFIKHKILEKTHEKIDLIQEKSQNKTLNKALGSLLNKNQKHIDAFKTQLKDKAHEKIAEVVAQMSELSCECRQKYSDSLKQYFELKVFSLNRVNDKLLDFMKGKYMHVAQQLKADFRIFTGVNAMVFLILFLVSVAKPQAVRQLGVPAVLLLISSLVCSYFYLFQQNWFFTILYDSYVGWFYLTYLIVVFGLLCDVAFNQCRITEAILNFIGNVLGNLSIGPC